MTPHLCVPGPLLLRTARGLGVLPFRLTHVLYGHGATTDDPDQEINGLLWRLQDALHPPEASDGTT